MLYAGCFFCVIILYGYYHQRKLKEQIKTLHYENNKHNKMLNVTVEAVVFFVDQKIVDLNDAAVELFGYSLREELLGKSYKEFVSSDHIKNVNDKISKRFIGKYEIFLKKKDGTLFPSIVQINRFEETDNSTTIVNILDLTDIKKREHILSQNIKMAQMGEMIGNIAHQWRQPLSIISTAASGIKMKQEYASIEKEELYHLLDSIVLNSEYLSKTIDVFRNFIKEKVELKEVVIQERINNALAIIETRIQNEHICLINKINYQENIKVIIILGELSQVIINIINNSIDVLEKKNGPEKLIIIDLETTENAIIISIEDNGGGICEEVLPHIFEPYFTTKYKANGTGIGLYMSYDIIVNHMKGKLYAKNTEIGAKFFIELPIEKRKKERRVIKDTNILEERRVYERRKK